MTDMRERIATVLIDTVDIVDYLISCEVDEVRNGISTCSIVADYSLYDFINIRNGLSINVEFYYSDDTTTKHQKFNGIINNIKQQGSDVIMQGVDISWKTTGETITKVYRESDSYGGDPVKILIDMYSYVDIVADNSTIDPTSVILPEITCDSAYVAEKTRTIVDALGWDQWYSPIDNKQHVTNPDLYTLISKDFIVGDNVLDLPDYNDNIYQTVNEIELQGVYSDSAYEEKFSGDGITTKFNLNRKPLSTYIYVTVDGIEQKGSVDGANTTYDYLINKQQGFIEFKDGSIPASGTNNIVVNYTATELTSVTVDDEDSQVDNTKRKIVISVKDAISVDDGIQRAKSLIKKSKSNYYNFDCEVINGLEYSTHNKVNYSDSVNNVFLDNAFINKITWKYPSISDTFSISNKQFNADDLFYRTEERVRRLERKRQEGQILTINKISNASLKVRVDDLVVSRASFGATVNSDTFYIDNVTQIYDSSSNGSWSNLNNITESIDPNVCAYYTLDCDLKDSTGFYELTNNNTTEVSGVIGNGRYFDGTASLSNRKLMSNPGTALSLSSWIKFDTTFTAGGTGGTLFNKTNLYYGFISDAWWAKFDGATGALIVSVYIHSYSNTPKKIYSTTTSWTAGTKYNIVVTWGPNGGLKLYVNGVLESTESTATTVMASGNKYSFSVGDNLVNCMIDEIGVFNKELNTSDITEYYNSGTCKRPTGLNYATSNVSYPQKLLCYTNPSSFLESEYEDTFSYFNSGGNSNGNNGCYFTTKDSIKLKYIEVGGSTTATKLYIYDNTGTILLGSAPIVSKKATFENPILLEPNTQYITYVNSEGSSYIYNRSSDSVFPYYGKYVNITNKYGLFLGPIYKFGVVLMEDLTNNKIVGISFDITGKTTGTGTTEIEYAQLMINYFPVGEIKTSSTSFTNTDSTITLGGNSDKWGADINYYNITRDGFGIILKFKNNATTINIKNIGVNIYYKNSVGGVDVVKSATKLDKSDYDNGTDNTVAEVTLTHTADNKLEVTNTV